MVKTRKLVFIAVIVIFGILGIGFLKKVYIQKQQSEILKTREISIPAFHVTFRVPNLLQTGHELHSSIEDDNNAQSVVRLYRKDTKYSKDENGYDVADNTIIFSFDNPYGIDPIYGTGQFVAPFYAPSQSLINSLSFQNSILQKRAVNFFYFMDTQHKRFNNVYTNTFMGKIRMDLLTSDHIDPTIGLIYSCYDQSKNGIDLCKTTFQQFISSVKFQGSTLGNPPPLYTEDNIFGLIPIVKRNFDLQKNIQVYQNNKDILIPYYLSSKAQDLVALKDNNLRSIQCMPNQIFHFETPDIMISPLIGIHLPNHITDRYLQKIMQSISAKIPIGYDWSQFTACKTDDARYIVKYNQVPKEHTYIANNDIAYAKIAVITPNWDIQNIVDIPNKSAYCNHFLALTDNNTLYFECSFYQPDINNRGNDIYKINLTTKSYSRISTCNFPTYTTAETTNFCF